MTTYEVHTQSGGKWRMESAYDDRQLAQVSADMLLDERGDVEAVRVAEEVPIPGAKSKYRIVYIKDRLGNVTAPQPKPAPRPAPAVPTVPPPKVYVPKRPAGRIPDLPRRPRPPSPIPDPAPAKPAAKRRPGMDKKAASHLSRQLVLYILIAGGLALGAMAATTFAKQIIRLLVPG